MLFQRKYQKSLRIFWMIVSALVIVGMILLYLPSFFV